MGTRYPLADVPLVLGRDEDSDIPVPDESASRRHAVIHPTDGGYTVTDLQSTNGTYVNEVRVATRLLRDGDYLHIGKCIWRFLAGGNLEAQYHEEIHRLAIIDGLTEVYNRRYLQNYLAHELACACRYERHLSLALFDVDHFKRINDTLGHLGGDAALRELAVRVKETVRSTDVVARFGGEEFAVVMPDTCPEQALLCGERLRQGIAARPFWLQDGPYPVTISLGVATYPGKGPASPDELIRRADERLMHAKRAGRNRVER
jgi:diguanylate cyclase (GGDEF)-like protein